mmetsp:Transcript_10219/g.20453  ORF Transcript_10219/g.20453 Transcript_10219/m.20453 type:complete len:254 (-) Transcript_10219:159-920(-)
MESTLLFAPALLKANAEPASSMPDAATTEPASAAAPPVSFSASPSPPKPPPPPFEVGLPKVVSLAPISARLSISAASSSLYRAMAFGTSSAVNTSSFSSKKADGGTDTEEGGLVVEGTTGSAAGGDGVPDGVPSSMASGEQAFVFSRASKCCASCSVLFWRAVGLRMPTLALWASTASCSGVVRSLAITSSSTIFHEDRASGVAALASPPSFVTLTTKSGRAPAFVVLETDRFAQKSSRNCNSASVSLSSTGG